jgi:hypothetical protein
MTDITNLMGGFLGRLVLVGLIFVVANSLTGKQYRKSFLITAVVLIVLIILTSTSTENIILI